MYMAMGTPSKDGEDRISSTNLHQDMADAVNIMVYAYPPGSCALWDIFSAGDSLRISDYLQKRYQEHNRGHPIHSQQYYLQDNDLKILATQGVRPYTIKQCKGQAIMIPAGCPHQVSLSSQWRWSVISP